jgi:hypothetical protein
MSSNRNQAMPSRINWVSTDENATRNTVTPGVIDGSYVADGTIVAGDWVMWDTGEITGRGAYTSVIQATAAANNALVCGVALNAATEGQDVRVRHWGLIHPNQEEAVGVNVATAVNIGESLVMSGATAGQAIARTAETDRRIGVAISEPAANVATAVWVTCVA